MSAIIVSDWASFITAVGTTDAEVEFPKNLVKTQDTDVDPNKLYTDANGVVQTNVQLSDLANLYENTFVLDANDYEESKYGLSDSIYLRCASFNGYGGSIKNVACINSSNSVFRINRSYITSVSFRNLAFLNYRTVSSLFSPADNRAGSINFRTCIFSGEATKNNSGTLYLLDCAGSIYCCSFTMRNIGNVAFSRYENHGGYGNFQPRYCRIKLIDKLDSGTFELEDCYNCYIGGETNATIYFRGNGNEGEYNVIDCETPSVTFANTMTVSLANSDKCSSIQSGFESVTTEQLKDADYLSSIGFPIQT